MAVGWLALVAYFVVVHVQIVGSRKNGDERWEAGGLTFAIHSITGKDERNALFIWSMRNNNIIHTQHLGLRALGLSTVDCCFAESHSTPNSWERNRNVVGCG